MGEEARRPGADLVAEGRRRYEAGDYSDAEPLARSAVALRAVGTEPSARAEALQLLGEVLYSLGKYPDAATIAEEAATLRAAEPDEVRAETLNLQGVVDIAAGDPARGLERLEAAYRLREAALGRDHPDTLESLNNTGVALMRLDRMQEAIERHEDALRRCERAFDEPTRPLAVTLNALAVKLTRDEETRPRARELYARALEVGEAALGPEHPLVATLVANQATQAINDGDFEAARPFANRSLELHERRYGHDHPSTANALAISAQLAAHDERLDDAIALYQRAAAIRLDAFGIGDKRTHGAVVALANLYGRRIKEGSASDDDRAEGVALFGVYRNLDAEKARAGPFAFADADPAAAERDLRAYLARVASRAGLDSGARAELDRARSTLVAADANFGNGDTDAAAVAIASAIERIERVRGAAALELVEPLHRLAAVERARDRREMAIELDERALTILAAAYGDRHPYVIKARFSLALASEREYGTAAGREQLERVRAALAPAAGDGLAARLNGLIEQHLAHIPPGAEADPVGVSARRRAALEQPTEVMRRLRPGLLSEVAESAGRGDPRAPQRPALDVASELLLLLAEDRLVVRDALSNLAGTVLQLPSLVPWTASAAAFLIGIADDPRVPHRGAAAALLSLLGTAAVAEQAVAATHRHESSGPAAAAIVARLGEIRALLRRLGGDPDPTVRRAATFGLGEIDAVTGPQRQLN